MSKASLAFCVLSALVSSSVLAAQTSAARIERHAGCYDLTLGSWKNAPISSNSAPHKAPAHFRLDTTPIKQAGFQRYAVEPALPFSGRMAASWMIRDDSIELFWSTGYSGIQLRLAMYGDSLAGVATAFHDSHPANEPPDPSATATARRVACPSK